MITSVADDAFTFVAAAGVSAEEVETLTAGVPASEVVRGCECDLVDSSVDDLSSCCDAVFAMKEGGLKTKPLTAGAAPPVEEELEALTLLPAENEGALNPEKPEVPAPVPPVDADGPRSAARAVRVEAEGPADGAFVFCFDGSRGSLHDSQSSAVYLGEVWK
jgi:hypothetical protein